MISALTSFSTLSIGAAPIPFPLPQHFSFGSCGPGMDGPDASPSDCFSAMTLAANFKVVADSACVAASPLATAAYARYSTLLSRNAAPTVRTTAGSYWWSLNTTNCNLHDLPHSECKPGSSIASCRQHCEATPNCGGFLYYGNTGIFAMKNTTCNESIAPLPCTPSFQKDCNDTLNVLRNVPMPPPSYPGTLSSVKVCVRSPDETLGAGTNESYSLIVPAASAPAVVAAALIDASSVFGAMHALESLAQLVEVRAAPNAAAVIPSAPVKIIDAPRYSFRGVMIDSGRHYLPLAHIKRVVDACAMAKLNVIHWHLVDSQSFASDSETYPRLAKMGAYPNDYSRAAASSPSTAEVPKAIYTVEDMKSVVAYARERGVRIQPEWDMPGHGAWGFGHPELMSSSCSNVLDPTRDELYVFLLAFLTEMNGIFTEEYLFLGGDEVSLDCFDNSPTIAAWMKQHQMNASELQTHFWQQMTKLVFPKLPIHRTVSVWENDVLQIDYSALPKSSVVNVYQSLNTAWTKTIPAGMPTVVSMAGSKWYLDSECPSYSWKSWQCRYAFSGVNKTTWLEDQTWSAEERALFLGGESAMWGEGVNGDNFDGFVWRGATAVAERLWATEENLSCPPSLCPGIKNSRVPSYWLEVESPRFGDQLCRMSQRGIKTGPVGPGFCPSDAFDNAQGALRAENEALKQELADARRRLAAVEL